MRSLTPRGKVLRHLKKHRGIKERPAGSNTDDRPNSSDSRWGIRRAQLACANGGTWLVGTPWCGEWAFWALKQAGVRGISSRLASVALIESDARARKAPFFDWREPWEWRKVHRGDLVVMFGRGVHVEVVRSFKRVSGSVVVVTEGGNTSSGTGGDQSNGGGAFRRERALSDVHGFARVNYPGGRSQRMLPSVAVPSTGTVAPTSGAVASSDDLLVAKLPKSGDAAKLKTQVRAAE